MEHAGLMKLLKKEALAKADLTIRILTPVDDTIKDIVQKFKREVRGRREEEQLKKIDILYIEQPLLITNRVSVLVVDKKFSMVVELKDDTKEDSYEAVGLATYSNSKSTILSYVTIFESFWRQAELYERSKNELHDTKDELAHMKNYLNEVIKEINAIKNKTQNSH
jgi:hypothetical protein